MEFLWQALRQVVFLLDQVAYGLIPSAYELIFYIANVNLFDNDILSAVINRVYLLLGIFMLFKVAFSLIQYMIDPNTFSDKAKGFGKLITNTLVAIILLVMTPFIFEKAYDFQGEIILSNVIPMLILGDTSYGDYSGDKTVDMSNVEERQSTIHSMGVDVQFTLFSAFFTLNTHDNTSGYEACRPTSDAPLKNVLGSSDMLKDGACWTDSKLKDDLTAELHKQGGTLRGMFKYSGDKTSTGEVCPNGICDERDFGTFGTLLWWMKGGNSTFTITYIPIVSALVGGYLLLLLVTFAIDIATRVFKLLFLQAVAPIAIISYMDPKESAGSGKFHNWLVECGKTYGSLFLRLAVIYAAIQLVRVILSTMFGVTDGGSSSMYYKGIAPNDTLNIFVYIFLVLGVFTFAKKVPQMIESIFDIKMSGEMSLNPFKTFKEIGSNPLVAGGIGALGGGAQSLAANAIAAGKKTIDWGKNGGIDKVRQNLNTIRTNAGNAMALTQSNFRNMAQDRMSIGDFFKYSGRAFKVARKDTHAAIKANPTGFKDNVSDYAGILTGAVSGAVRGGKTGATSKKGVESATKARQEVTKARENRDIKQAGGLTPKQQFIDAVDKFANIKNKEAVVGKAEKDVTEKTREMENLKEEESAARRARTQLVISSGLDPKELEQAIYRGTRSANGQLVRSLDANGKPEPPRTYQQYITEFNANPSAFGGGTPISEDVFNNYRAASVVIDSADERQAEIRREVSNLNKLTNLQSGDKK